MKKDKSVKEKVKAKAKEVKAKVKSKVKGATAAIAALALAMAFLATGCATSDPASRQTYATYNFTFKFGDHAKTVNVTNTLGDGALASADSEGSTETMTSSPTNDVKPDTNIDIPINKSGGGAQSVGSVLGDAVATGVGKLIGGSGTTSDASKATDAKAATNATECAPCTDGTCGVGGCTTCQPK